MSNDVENLKILVDTAAKIIDEELLPNIGGIAVQDYERLNKFMIDARPIQQELKNNE